MAPLTVLITGAAKRVGAEIARELARSGAAHLILHYHRSGKHAKALAQEITSMGVRADLVRADLARLQSCRDLARQVKSKAPALNAVVFNASAYYRTPFGTVTEKQWDDLMNTNLKSYFFLSQDLAGTLKTNSPSQIVLVADWSGLRPYSKYIPYCLSKTGVLYLTHALAKVLAPKVRVNAVLPGHVLPAVSMPSTQIEAARQAALLKSIGTPQSVARAVRFFLQEADFSTGAWLTVDGGRLIAP